MQFFIQPDKTTASVKPLNSIEGWWVDDDSEETPGLASKIDKLYPFFNFVCKDERLVDITDDTEARAAFEAESANRPLTLDDIALALAESYERNEAAITDVQLALAEIYEAMIGGEVNG